uniref:Putative jockey ele1 orf2-h 1e-120-j 4 n=1 Tax=Ixodes ricinus TaxID=34613 RepID=A0A0K8RG16_IXORI
MSITKSFTVTQSQYSLLSQHLEHVSSYKYLGIHFTDTLSWNDHIEYITSSALKTLGFLRRTLYLAPPKTKLLAYKTIVLPKLEYACTIWNPHQTYLLQRLESVQNKAVRFICNNYSPETSASALKASNNLSALELRRKITRLCFFHSIYYSDSPFKSVYCRPASFISHRLDHSRKLEPIFSRTNTFLFSPLLLCIRDWNTLPDHIVTDSNPISFRDQCSLLYNYSP